MLARCGCALRRVDDQAGTSSAIAPSSTSDPSTASWVLLEAQMEVEFFHCEKANFWDTESSCRICADAEDDVVEVDVSTFTQATTRISSRCFPYSTFEIDP